MNILIITIIATVFIAGIGAVVYMLIHRAKHKKEVLDNSQYNAIPNFGGDNGSANQQKQTQPIGSILDSPASQGGGVQDTANNTIMNDITQGSPSPQQDSVVQETPITPPTPVPPASDIPQPEVNRNFPGNSPEPEVPANNISGSENANNPAQTPEQPVNTLNLGQKSPAPEAGNILKDTKTTNTVEELAKNTEEVMVDSSMDDSKVPVTNNEDAVAPASPVESPQPAQPAPDAEPVQPVETPDVPAESPADTGVAPEPVSNPAPAPETPVTPSTLTDIPAPQTPESSVAPSSPADTPIPQPASSPAPVSSDISKPDNTDDSQDAGASEMHI